LAVAGDWVEVSQNTIPQRTIGSKTSLRVRFTVENGMVDFLNRCSRRRKYQFRRVKGFWLAAFESCPTAVIARRRCDFRNQTPGAERREQPGPAIRRSRNPLKALRQ